MKRTINSTEKGKDVGISPGMIPGYGMGNALELHMQDKQGGDVGKVLIPPRKQGFFRQTRGKTEKDEAKGKEQPVHKNAIRILASAT